MLVAILASVTALAAAPVDAARPDRIVEADVRVRVADATTFDVTMTLTLEMAAERTVDHRLMLYPGTSVGRVGVSGGGVSRQPERTIGTTRSLPMTIGAGRLRYQITYRVVQPVDWSYRCPVWLPEVPTDGTSRSVRIGVELPVGAVLLPDAFPALAPSEGAGEASVTLGHLPAVLRLLHAPRGERPSWLDRVSRRRLVDVAAIVILAAAAAIRVMRRGR
jgi:hypothetical protein